MQVLSRHGRLNKLIGVAIFAAVLVSLASCGSQEASIAERKAALAARDVGAERVRANAPVVSDEARPVLPPERDLGAILDRGVFKPLVIAEAPQSVGGSTTVPTDQSGVPITFTDEPRLGPPPGLGPTAPPGEGGNGEDPSVLGEPSACQLAITGVVRDPNGYRLLVRFIPSGETRWAVVGEEVFGYIIEAVTLQGAVVSKEGRYYILPLGQNADTPSGTGDGATPGEGGEGALAAPEGGESGGEAAEARFHGTWSGSMMEGRVSMTISFKADHTGSAEVMGQSDSFTWSANGGTINTTGGKGGPQSLNFRFENGDKTLVLSGGQMPFEVRLEKQ